VVVREQLGPGMGDQAIVAKNNENLEQDFFHCEYAQYEEYAYYNMLNMHNMHQLKYAQYA
jgi:hypothetical protein